MSITSIRTAIASMLARMARAAAPEGAGRSRLADAIVALGRGGPGAPE